MYYRSHKWVDAPHTAYERRRELRVREPKQTAMVFDIKYQNIDTGKYDTDKIRSINTLTIGDIFSSSTRQNQTYEYEEISTNEIPREIKAYDDLRTPKAQKVIEHKAIQDYKKQQMITRMRASNKARKERKAQEKEEKRLAVERDYQVWLDEKEIADKDFNEQYAQQVALTMARRKIETEERIAKEAKIAEEKARNEIKNLRPTNMEEKWEALRKSQRRPNVWIPK